MTSARHIADRYLATWNETNTERRGALLADNWATDARYVDPMTRAAGAAEISGLIGGVQARFPGFRFTLKGTPDGFGDYVRFSWALGPEGQDAPIEGSDVITVAGERIAAVVGFLDKVPQAA